MDVYINAYLHVYNTIPKHTFGVSDLEVTIHRFSRSISYDKKNEPPFRIFPHGGRRNGFKGSFSAGLFRLAKHYFTRPNYGKDMQGLFCTRYIHRLSFLHNWVVKDSIPKNLRKKILQNLDAGQKISHLRKGAFSICFFPETISFTTVEGLKFKQ